MSSEAGDPSTKVLRCKVAIVTGAGRGVGQGIALALASAGARVVVAARSAEKAEPTVEAIRGRGGEALAVVCDVSKRVDVERCVAETLDAWSTIDILVNNANVAPYGSLLDVSDEAFELGIRVGPLAALRFMRACHPHLRDGGVIVNLTSGSALRADSHGLGAYAALKEAMSRLTRTAAVEWGPDGIRAVAVMPFAESDAMQWWREQDPAAYQAVLDEVPLRRIGDPELDVGGAVVWLCSQGAAYITGSTLVVDGGQSYLR